MSDFNWFQKLIGMPKLAEDVADQLRSFRDEDCSPYIDELEDERVRRAELERKLAEYVGLVASLEAELEACGGEKSGLETELADMTRLYTNLRTNFDAAVDNEREECNDRCNRELESLHREMMRRTERYETEIEALEAQVALLQQELKDCRGN